MTKLSKVITMSSPNLDKPEYLYSFENPRLTLDFGSHVFHFLSDFFLQKKAFILKQNSNNLVSPFTSLHTDFHSKEEKA